MSSDRSSPLPLPTTPTRSRQYSSATTSTTSPRRRYQPRLFTADVNSFLRESSAPAINAPTPPRMTILDDLDEDGAASMAAENNEESMEAGPGTTSGSKQRGQRRKFTSNQLIELARVSVDLDPWHAKHKEKGKTWDEVRARLVANRVFDTSVSTGTLRNKMNDLIKWHTVRDLHLYTRMCNLCMCRILTVASVAQFLMS